MTKISAYRNLSYIKIIDYILSKCLFLMIELLDVNIEYKLLFYQIFSCPKAKFGPLITGPYLEWISYWLKTKSYFFEINLFLKKQFYETLQNYIIDYPFNSKQGKKNFSFNSSLDRTTEWFGTVNRWFRL